jgi:asparagine synthase (glutamine-hydrolysing)
VCGIAGLFDPDSRTEGLEAQARAMAGLLRHRGPDEDGFYVEPPVALGMRRLSIIDIGGGTQPIGNEDGALQVVQNGEIYNYLELREALLSAGHHLRTRSDTEVLVHLYEEYGAAFPSRLNGMFAFAIWDGRRRTVILGRDRLGKKPLFLARDGRRVAWASEIKPLLRLPWVSRRIRPEALNLLLRHNYVPGLLTMFEGITEVTSGSTVTITEDGLTTTPFWSLSQMVPYAPDERGVSNALETTAELFDDAVRLRMRSDVPVGLFLSGGVDSSLIAERMVAHAGGTPVESMAMAFDEAAFDESAVAEAVAAVAGTRHRTIRGALSGNLDLWKRALWSAEEPHGDASFMPTLLLSQAAARTHKVVMTGDGGDEVFGGYTRYQVAWHRAQATTPDAAWSESQRTQHVFDDAARRAVLGADWYRDVGDEVDAPTLRLSTPGDVVRNLMWRDCAGLLTDNNVIKPDRMGMAASLEARCPLLDYRLAEHALALPGETHVDATATKRLLRPLLSRRFPSSVTERPKQQFTVPVGEWMKRDETGAYRAALDRLNARGLCAGAEVDRLWGAHRATGQHTRPLRLLIALELWCQVFLDGDPLSFESPGDLSGVA